VVLILSGQQDKDEPKSGRAARRASKAGRRQHGLLPEILGRVESIDAQLSAIGERIGAGPDVSDLDQQIAQARRDKEAAAGAEDYETAAALRDRERQLLAARQQEWASAHLDLASLAEYQVVRRSPASGPAPPAGHRPARRRRLDHPVRAVAWPMAAPGAV
jgi:hypothetical protein